MKAYIYALIQSEIVYQHVPDQVARKSVIPDVRQIRTYVHAT